jgi:tetratricopeptide (TPR) repeat protein
MKNLIKLLNDRLFSSTYQIQRIVILVAIALGLALVSFGSYYYYDRYYTNQPKFAEVNVGRAEQAVRDNPNDPEVRLGLAETYMANRRFDEAIELAQNVRDTYPDNQHAWFVLGIANALKGNPEGAIEPLQKLLDANKEAEMPGLNKALQSAAYYLGDSYLQLGAPDKAAPVLEQAVDWSQTDADAMYKLGKAYMGIGQYDKAISILQVAANFVPNYTEVYTAMADSFTALNQPALVDYAHGMEAYSTKNYSNALELLLKSAQAKPNFAPTFTGLGLTYEAKNDLQNAKSSFEVALKLSREDFSASNGLQRVDALLNK